jgi:hypothetical protein
MSLSRTHFVATPADRTSAHHAGCEYQMHVCTSSAPADNASGAANSGNVPRPNPKASIKRTATPAVQIDRALFIIRVLA